MVQAQIPKPPADPPPEPIPGVPPIPLPDKPPQPPPTEPPPASVADRVQPENLKSGMCSWPEGDPGTEAFRFCGKSVAPDKPYCPEHCDRAYDTTVKKRKSAWFQLPRFTKHSNF